MSSSSQFFKIQRTRRDSKIHEVSRQYKNGGTINLQKFSWIDMDEFEMQLIEFQSNSTWKQKFITLELTWKTLKKSD